MNNYNKDKLMKAMIRQQAILDYELSEGFLQLMPGGYFVHTTPEMLGIDDSIFEGLEDVVKAIINEEL